jgi:phthalate 4,5-cis-dihydrodiol dehydrogenase
VSAPKPLRCAVAGLGRAFTVMLPTFVADPRVRVVAAADPRAEARQRFEADFNAPAYAEVEALCRDPAVDLVYVATPHGLHAEHAILAARHGKHVLVEKPMALTLDDCTRMIDAADAAGVQLVVGHSHGFDAPIRRVREWVERGSFGAVGMIHALYYTDFLYRPRRPEELDTARGGGVLFNQAAHQVDIVRLLAGGLATRVRASTTKLDPQRDTEGAYCASITFASGAFASLTYSGYGRFDSDEFCGWIGELGMPKDPAAYGAARRTLASAVDAAAETALKNARNYGGAAYRPADRVQAGRPAHEHFGTYIVSCERADLRPLPDGVMIYDDERAWLDPLPRPEVPRREVIDEIVTAIESGRPALHDGRWARATLEVCLAMLESAHTAQEVPLAHQVHVPAAGV